MAEQSAPNKPKKQPDRVEELVQDMEKLAISKYQAQVPQKAEEKPAAQKAVEFQGLASFSRFVHAERA